MSAVSWTDGTGSATLASSWPAPGNRFKNWVPFNVPIGEGAHGLGDGMRYQFRFRTDYGARFEIPGIQRTDVDLAIRLQEHLLSGGIVTVTTNDASSREYTECCLAPETQPELELTDSGMIEYTMRLAVINVAVSPTAMLCEYA